jgi:hypothetical protein
MVLILLAMPLAANVGPWLLVGARRGRHVAAFSLGFFLLYPLVGGCLAIFASHQVHQNNELGMTDRDVLEKGRMT